MKIKLAVPFLLAILFMIGIGSILVIRSNGINDDEVSSVMSASTNLKSANMAGSNRYSSFKKLSRSYPRSTQAELNDALKAVGLDAQNNLAKDYPRSTKEELDAALRAVGMAGQFQAERQARSTQAELDQAISALSENGQIPIGEAYAANQLRSSEKELAAAVLALAESEGLSMQLDKQYYPRSSEEELIAAINETLHAVE